MSDPTKPSPAAAVGNHLKATKVSSSIGVTLVTIAVPVLLSDPSVTVAVGAGVVLLAGIVLILKGPGSRNA